MIDIAVVGWLTVDDIVLTDGTTHMSVPGGGALYAAIGARIWNESVGLHSVAGKPHAEETRRRVIERGIDASAIGTIDGHGLELWLLHESEVHKQQVPKLTSSNPFELDRLRGPLPQRYREARGFHIAPQGPESSIANARALSSLAGSPVVTMDILSDAFVDASLYRDLAFLSHLTAFLPSEAEVERIWAPASLEAWLRIHALAHSCHMGAKLGAKGALLCDGTTGALIHVPALPVRVVDTTGAGDGFCGGFLAGLVAGKPLSTCAAMATVSASYVVESCGALETPRPDPAERDERLARVLAGITNLC
jgi:sugar/nucleoside kinase (ribokinase family)